MKVTTAAVAKVAAIPLRLLENLRSLAFVTKILGITNCSPLQSFDCPFR
jgi:hypothetical protein